MPCLVAARALGKDGMVAPSERILMSGIGLAGRDRGDLNAMLVEPDVQFLAICDPNKSRREILKRIVDEKYANKDYVTDPDIREYLALRTDLAAVLIATGDKTPGKRPAESPAQAKPSADKFCETPLAKMAPAAREPAALAAALRYLSGLVKETVGEVGESR